MNSGFLNICNKTIPDLKVDIVPPDYVYERDLYCWFILLITNFAVTIIGVLERSG